MLRSLLTLTVCAGGLLFSSFDVRADETSTPQQVLRSHPPDVFALTGVKVVVSPERTLESATMVVRDGRIEAVGTDVTPPADAKVIPLTGKTVYAGFIDAFAEQSLSTDRLAGTSRYWNGQVTSQLSVANQVTPSNDASALRRQGVTTQIVVPADGVVRGQAAAIALTEGEANSLVLRPSIAQVVQLTVSFRNRTGGFPGSPMGAVALARQAFYDAQWYRDAHAAVAADPTLPPVESNDALAALQPTLNGAMPVIVPCSNEQSVLRAEKFATEFGLNLIVKGSGSEYRRLEEIVAMQRPVILPLSLPQAPNVATPESAADVTLETLLHWDIAPENAGRLDGRGLKLAFGADRLSNKGDFLKAVRLAVDRGLSPSSALKALTTTPAALFGLSQELGTVEAGRRASFVITDGDLFDRKTKVVETWVNGTRYEHSPEPSRKAAGYYELTLSESAGFPDRLFVEITEADGRLRGRVSREPIAKSSERRGRRGEGDVSGKGPESASGSRFADDKPADAPAADIRPQDEKPAETDAAETKSGDPAALTQEKAADGKSADEAAKSVPVIDLESVRLNDTALTAQFKGKPWEMDGVIRLTLTLTESDAAVRDRVAAIGSLVWHDGSTSTASATRRDPPDAGPGGTAEESGAGKDAAVSAAAATPEKKGADEVRKPVAASFDVNFPLGAFGRSSIPPAVSSLAFVHATIWTCGPEGILEDATLLIGDGKIVAVGRDVEIPEGTEVVDVQGLHISPGIIDCHSHMATDGGVNEGTDAITCEVRIGDFVDANDVTIYRQLAGGVTGANILHGSANPIGGQNQVIKLRWGQTGEQMKFTEAPPGVKFALGENVKQSNRTGGGGRYPNSRMGVEQVYRDSFEAARDYANKWKNWQQTRRGLPPRRDLELEALQEIVEGRRWIHCHSYRQDEILALIRILDEYDVTIGTFQHILEGYKVADEMAKHGAMASAFSDWWAYKFEVYDAIPHAGALMHQQGVVVSFNSDDGELARHLNQEAAKAIKYGGVEPEEALKFVTLNPARQLRVDHLVGSLEPGKHADFVLWSGNPLSNFSRCEETWIDGRRYFDRDEDMELRKLAAEKRNALIQKVLTSGEDMRGPGERDVDPAGLWPRFDEYCHHFSHLMKAKDAQQEQGRQ
jgi:N-acetylglucosamine-6-phosphate deacetylase